MMKELKTQADPPQLCCPNYETTCTSMNPIHTPPSPKKNTQQNKLIPTDLLVSVLIWCLHSLFMLLGYENRLFWLYILVAVRIAILYLIISINFRGCAIQISSVVSICITFWEKWKFGDKVYKNNSFLSATIISRDYSLISTQDLFWIIRYSDGSSGDIHRYCRGIGIQATGYVSTGKRAGCVTLTNLYWKGVYYLILLANPVLHNGLSGSSIHSWLTLL